MMVRHAGGRQFLLGLFLVCMTGLMLQIIETRLISVILWYHLAFLAISMAMLGMTVGSLLVYFKAELFTARQLLDHLTWIGAAMAISIMLSMGGLISTIAPSTTANTAAMSTFIWLKLIVTLLPPYVLAGMAVSLALTRSPWPVGIVYAVDLVGAACGCLVVLAVLTWADPISALMGTAAVAAVGSVCFAWARRVGGGGITALPIACLGRQGRPAMLAIGFGVLAVLNAAVQPTNETKRWRDGLTLLMSKDNLELEQPAVVRWNTFSRVRAGREYVAQPFLWGPSPTTPPMQASQRFLDIDGSAGTPMYRFDGKPEELGFLRFDVTNLAYAIRHDGRAAIIGVGGGRDILSAWSFGFRDITGVELNPIFIDLLTGEYRDYNHLAELPGVRLFVDEARSWFARTHEHFDLIEMSLIDTWAATGAGAYSLSENGLYTVEGWRHFIDALAPTGVLTVSRWYNPKNVTEIGRLLSLAATSLADRGISDPQNHVFVAATDKLATIVVAKSAFTAGDLAGLRARANELRFRILVDPGAPAASPVLDRILTARSPAELAAIAQETHLDVSAPRDDRPFFFNEVNLSDLGSLFTAFGAQGGGVISGNLLALLALLKIVLLSGLLVVYAMIVPAAPAYRQAPPALARLGSLYFLSIGLGFMFVEIGLIQRLSTFLGHPVYGMAIGLFGIILSTGIGSLISERVVLFSAKRVGLWACLLGGYLLALPLWFPQLTAAYEGDGLFMRALVSLAAILPSGLLMGFGFPTGMRLCNTIDARPTPWFWAVNGAAGVLGAGIAVATSITVSINVSLWIGAACYLLTLPAGMALATLRPQAEAPQVGTAPAPAAV